MSERERLADLIRTTPKLEFAPGSRAQGKTYQTAQNMADHLLENGAILPPCKVGDKVYFLCRDQETYEWYICEREVYSISVYENSTHIYVSPIISFAEIQIGVLVFLTKEEAEKALAERSRA